MNWDISIGHCKQFYGRALQEFGRRFERRALVLRGEDIEFAGRLQMRYGLLKHEAQWGDENLARISRQVRMPRLATPVVGSGRHRAP